MDNTLIVKNRSASVVTYLIPEDGIRRTFMPGESKRISDVELEKLTFQPGGMTLLAKFLQITDPQIVQNIGIKAEPEYFMNERDVANLITSAPLPAFLDALDFAPTGVIDLIKKLSVEIPMTDFQKRKALKDVTGFDVDAAITHEEESKEDSSAPIRQTGERRVKPEAPAQTGRRTAPPTYNVVSKGN